MTDDKARRDPPICFRASKQDRKNLEALMKRWGENQTESIKRALQLAAKKGE